MIYECTTCPGGGISELLYESPHVRKQLVVQETCYLKFFKFWNTQPDKHVQIHNYLRTAQQLGFSAGLRNPLHLKQSRRSSRHNSCRQMRFFPFSVNRLGYKPIQIRHRCSRRRECASLGRAVRHSTFQPEVTFCSWEIVGMNRSGAGLLKPLFSKSPPAPAGRSVCVFRNESNPPFCGVSNYLPLHTQN
ncbi:Hypothetical_protein [Hexamita inflata]|uniref:Hypothetical_protein n=1 Tax=Hexamita inflata TaxID=28002 RepID=A0AA86NA72_9EUKA|nr:Hypothetical protein HINF_LOCUS3627 [Hexamita inflata]